MAWSGEEQAVTQAKAAGQKQRTFRRDFTRQRYAARPVHGRGRSRALGRATRRQIKKPAWLVMGAHP
ncbi:MAG: hypothetical protein NVSMB30_15600 [Hymenobacter sp.]